jgi:hypothetical protein
VAEGGFEYEVAIRDAMSGPSHHAAESLGDLTHALEKNEKALKKHGEVEHSTGEGLKMLGGKVIPGLTSSLEEMGEALTAASGPLAAIIIAIEVLEGIKEVAEKVFDIGEEFVKTSLEAAEFKEATVAAFEVVGDAGQEVAEETYANIEKIANSHHLALDTAMKSARELALSGVEDEGILASSVAAIGDLHRVGLEEGASKVRKLIEESEAAGHLVLPKKLRGAGFTLDDLAERLGYPKGTDLKKLKIDTQTGIQAIDDLIEGGNVGKLAAKKFDLTDVATSWDNIWKELKEDVNAGPLTAAFKDFVGNFSEGKPAFASLKDEIVHDVNRIIEVLADVVSHSTNFALKAELSFLLIKLAIQPLTNEFERMGGTHDVIHALGNAIKFAADHMLRLAEGTATVLGTLSAVGAVGGHVGGTHTGESFVQGLVMSLYAGIPTVHAAGHDLSAAAHEGAKTGIDAHSPSRKAFGLGEDYGEGYAMGGEASRDRVAAAMGDMAMPDLPPASPAGGGSSSSRSVNITIEAGAIVVQGGGESTHEMAEITLEQLADVVARAVEELGG